MYKNQWSLAKSFHALKPAHSWLICFVSTLFFFLEQIRMNMFNSIAPDVMSFYRIEAFEFGELSATYLLGIVLFLFPSGFLLDRYSIKTLLISALTFCIMGSLLLYFSKEISLAHFSMLIAGIGSSFCFLGATKLASRWFPPSKLGIVIGFIVTGGMLGGFIAQAPLQQLTNYISWRSILLLLILSEFIMIIAVLLIIEDYPSPYDKINKKTSPPSPFFSKILTIIQNKKNWLAGLYTSLINFPIIILGAIWGDSYLIQTRSLSEETASLISSMLFLGMMIGSPIIGWISDKIESRRIPMSLGASCALITVLIIILAKTDSAWLLAALFLLMGFFSSAQCIGYTVISEQNPSFLTGTAMSLAAILIMSGGAMIQPLFGWILDFNWNGKIINHTPFYSAKSYLYAMSILPIAFILSTFIPFALKENN